MSPRVHSVATTGCPKDSSGERGVEKWTSSCHGQNPRSGVLSACFCSRTAQEAIWSRTRKACGCCGVGVGVGVGGREGGVAMLAVGSPSRQVPAAGTLTQGCPFPGISIGSEVCAFVSFLTIYLF